MNNEPGYCDVSVIVGFKDWGLERLELSLTSIHAALQGLSFEVIVIDYGSEDLQGNQETVERTGSTYRFIETDGIWSRSRALNAGAEISHGKVLITTDADMLFSPRSLTNVVQRISADENQALVLQCRDLPPKYGADGVNKFGLNWQEFESLSTFRPRWGMGGMIAVSRQAFLDVRGFDERMEIYGGEDMDFAQRIQRSGRRIQWVEDPEVRMFHMWHPSSREATQKSAVEDAAVKRNSKIFQNDKSWIRNTVSWIHRPWDAPILATVVISTKNRAEYVAEAIHSVLAQSVQDFEIILIDDGSTDDTREIVESIQDSRIHYYYQESSGLAVARNKATKLAKGRYIVIHDDDDLMTSNRIEKHFEALQAGDHGTYGGWIDFDGETGKVVLANPGKEYSNNLVQFVGQAYVHATLMLSTELMRLVPYDESLRSGSDYSLAVRMSRSGYKLRHMHTYALLRRLHPKQVTHSDSSFQQSSWAFTKSVGMHNLSPSQVKFMKKGLDTAPITMKSNPQVLMNLDGPDAFANRHVIVNSTNNFPLELMSDRNVSYTSIKDSLDRVVSESAVIRDISIRQLGRLRSAHLSFTTKVGGWKEEYSNGSQDTFEGVYSTIVRGWDANSSSVCVSVIAESTEKATQNNLASWTVVDVFTVNKNGTTSYIHQFEPKSFDAKEPLDISEFDKYSNVTALSSHPL